MLNFVDIINDPLLISVDESESRMFSLDFTEHQVYYAMFFGDPPNLRRLRLVAINAEAA